ncbi:hypothetical protein [Streptomyces chartreusis]
MIDAAARAFPRPTGRQASRDCLQSPHAVRRPPSRLRCHARPTLDDLLNIGAPNALPDFDAFWRGCKAAADGTPPRPRLGRLFEERDGCRVREISYDTLGGCCAALLVLPVDGPARHGFVIGHG